MISRDEIISVADGTGLTPHVVEKDYVLGWMLAAIHRHPALSGEWVFKGGTCLKKCYFETYWEALSDFFAWLETAQARAASGLETIPGEGETYRPAYGRLNLGIQQNRPLEIIRFAAANRLWVDLDYTDKDGRRKIRTIEPYSLRRASTGDTLLHAVELDSGEARAYPVQGINNATLTHRTFLPRFKLELSPT